MMIYLFIVLVYEKTGVLNEDFQEKKNNCGNELLLLAHIGQVYHYESCNTRQAIF